MATQTKKTAASTSPQQLMDHVASAITAQLAPVLAKVSMAELVAAIKQIGAGKSGTGKLAQFLGKMFYTAAVPALEQLAGQDPAYAQDSFLSAFTAGVMKKVVSALERGEVKASQPVKQEKMGAPRQQTSAPTPILDPMDQFTVVVIPEFLDAAKLDNYRRDNYVDLIWNDYTIGKFGRTCLGSSAESLRHESYYFFPHTTDHHALVTWLVNHLDAVVRNGSLRSAKPRRKSRPLPKDIEGVRKCTKQDKDDRFYSNQQKWCTFSHSDDLKGRYVNKEDAVKRKLQMIVEYNGSYSDHLQPEDMVEVAYRIPGKGWKRHIVRNKDYDAWMDKLLERAGDVEVQTRDADPGSRPGPVRTL